MTEPFSPVPGVPLGRRMAVGLLGGSFNPAHAGHLHVSVEARKRLDLDEVWWLVSPQNPLKPRDDMGDFAERFDHAEALAAPHGIRVSDVEMRLGTRYTRDTLQTLRQALPRIGFVWLMGADNLAQLPRWQRWEELMRAVPIAIFARAPYSYRALAGTAAQRFAAARVAPRDARDLAWRAAPAWVYLPIPPHPASATAIRQGQRPPDAERRGKR